MHDAAATMSNNKRGGGGGPHHKKESILELAKLMDATVRVKCLGGRELQGTLRGYDDLVNLVLDDCDEFLRGMHNEEWSGLSWLNSYECVTKPYNDICSFVSMLLVATSRGGVIFVDINASLLGYSTTFG